MRISLCSFLPLLFLLTSANASDLEDDLYLLELRQAALGGNLEAAQTVSQFFKDKDPKKAEIYHQIFLGQHDFVNRMIEDSKMGHTFPPALIDLRLMALLNDDLEKLPRKGQPRKTSRNKNPSARKRKKITDKEYF